MASDLATTPHTSLEAQLCGDAHLSNFGLFASPERSLVFDINDFDETLPGPWEWDVKRLVASLAVAGRGNGVDAAGRERVVRAAAQGYRRQMNALAAMRELDVWYAHTSVDERLEASVNPTVGRQIRRTAAKARTRDNLQANAKLTRVVDGRRRLASDPPLLVPIGELVGEAEARAHDEHMGNLIDAYMQSLDVGRRTLITRFTYAGMARKVVGVGSVGTRAWIVLLLGRDDKDPLLMQVKAGRALRARGLPAAQRLFQFRRTGGRRAAADAGHQRHPVGLVALRWPGCLRGRLLRAPAARLERLGRRGVDESNGAGRLRAVLRRGARASAFAQR